MGWRGWCRHGAVRGWEPRPSVTGTALLQGHPSAVGGQGGPYRVLACVRAPRGRPICCVHAVLGYSFLTVSVICLENNLGLFLFY